MGNTPSRKALDKAIGALPESEHYFGLENFGNTCYCNSVLQALYYCGPFRQVCPSAFPPRALVSHAWPCPPDLADRRPSAPPLTLRVTLPIQRCLEHHAVAASSGEDDLLACLCDLFRAISSQKRRCGEHAPLWERVHTSPDPCGGCL